MQHEKEILCRYRLERAKEDLEAARVNHSSGLFKADLTVASIKLLMAHIGSGRNATIVISFWPQKKNLLFR